MVDAPSHHFIREIYQQPDGLRRTLADSGPTADALAAELADRADRVMLVGCGDPYFLSHAAAHAFEQLAGLPAEPVDGLEFVLYGGRRLSWRTLLVAISQSGKTIQAARAVRQARAAGALTVAVTNSPDSPITERAQAVLLTRCGLSLSFPTKTTTSALALLFRLAVALGQARGHLRPEQAASLKGELDALPARVEAALNLAPRLRALGEDLSGRAHFSFIGTGAGYTAALLGAAKLKETSHTRAEAHRLEEFAHVHIFAVQSGDPLFFIIPSDRASVRAQEIAGYIMDYGAHVVALTSQGSGAGWPDLGATAIELPTVEETFSPIVYAAPLQLFAHHLALARGHNPDRPARFDNAAHQKLVYSALLEGWYEAGDRDS